MITRAKYFEEVPLWGDKNLELEFEIVPHEIKQSANSKKTYVPSGNLPTVRLNSWRDLPALLDTSFFSQTNADWVFRGHRHFTWSLSPTLGRLETSGIVKKELADFQLSKFQKAIRGRIHDNSLLDFNLSEPQQNELWSIGQHHGLYTPLLDWTSSPYVALFFCFNEEDRRGDENPYRVIYALNRKAIDNDSRFEGLNIFEPSKDDHGRLVNQAGLFLMAPYENTIENAIINCLTSAEEDFDIDNANELARFICKIYVPNKERNNCMKQLKDMNVHHASLFPDLIGASLYCNSFTAQEFNRLAFEEATNAKKEGDASKALGKVDLSLIAEVRDEMYGDVGKAEVSIDDVENAKSAKNNGKVNILVYPYLPETDRKIFLKKLLKTEIYSDIELNTLVDYLDKEFVQHMVTDWDKKESTQAKLRNDMRKAFRKFNYPKELFDNKIVTILGDKKRRG